MVKLASLNDLLVHELQDIYHAEGQILKALPKMAKAATNPDLKAAFEEHRAQTEGQVRRLEQVFKLLGHPVKGKQCEGMAGLIEEGRKLLEADAEPEVLDAALIAAAQKVEHYEIASYGCVCTYPRCWATTRPTSCWGRIWTKRRRPTSASPPWRRA